MIKSTWHKVAVEDQERIQCQRNEYVDGVGVRRCVRAAVLCEHLLQRVGKRDVLSFWYYCAEHAREYGGEL